MNIKMTTEQDRIFLYWITTKIGGSTKFVYEHIHEMATHEDRELIGDDQHHEQAQRNLDNIKTNIETDNDIYVYMCKTNGDADGNVTRITTLIFHRQFYYLIDNVISTEGSIKSRIWFHVSPSGLGLILEDVLAKYLDIKKGNSSLSLTLNAHLSKKDIKLLSGVLPLDFVNTSAEKQSELWRRFVQQRREEQDEGGSLDLTGLYNLTPGSIDGAPGATDHITMIIMNNNKKLNDLSEWLPKFQNLKVLSIWNSDIKDTQLAGVPKSVTIVELHQCAQITGRCLLELSRLPLLEKIVIDNEYCKLQETTYETVITDEEWKTVKSDTVDTLFINSANLTLDFIDFCLKSFKKVANFIIHEQMIRKLEKNSRSGHTEHKISFHSASNINEGFYRYADVKVTDLVRNKISPAFSESMIRKIRELDPSKAAIIDASM